MVSLSLQRSTIDWQTLIRRFAGATIKGEKYLTPLKPNRRYENQPGWKYEYKSKLAVIMDTSASIIEEELNQFISEIEKISKYDTEITLIQVDESVTLITEYKSGKWKDLEIYGGGETNLQPAVDLAQSKTRVEGIIIFTDGHVDVPVVKRRVLFVLSSKHNPEFIEDATKIYGKNSVVILK
jgi:predicted metal-dependent peptidase